MTYVFSMSSRMVTIAVTCAVLLCALLFLMGVEIGARLVRQGAPQRADAVPVAVAPAPLLPGTAAQPAATQPPATTVGLAAAPGAPSTP
ncbi:hypothetical protein BJN34_34415 [Cupriavidus necator]|uniref:Uncharacterized protein n=1 Tax=Cupriavidus necator TaxID=106590 RepID=A0A1U9V3J9_CUPNE|nr:hypothetical protein [Cupriavidus necator]AQV98975.1 hypothetical protein BJN34_34415 [Cupriavidus necator]